MILRHGATYLATAVASALLGLVTTLLLTRLLGADAFGMYGLGQSMSTFVLYAVFEWLTWVVAPMLAKHAGPSGAMSVALDRMFDWTAACVGVGALVALVVLPEELRLPLLAACVSAVALGYFQLAAQFAVVRLAPERYALMNLARSIGTFGAAVGVAVAGAPVAVLLAAPAVGALLGLAVQGKREPRNYDSACVRDAQKLALRLGAPLAAVFGIYAVQLSTDRWIIDALAGTEQLGRYVAASMTIQVPISLLASAIGMAALPLALSAAREEGGARLHSQLRANFALLAGLVAPGAVGLAIVAPRLVPALVGQAYVATTIALAPWLCLAALASAMRGNYLDHAFYIAARTRPQVIVMTAMAVVQIVATVVLLPQFGLKGAAGADIAGSLVSGVLSIWYGRRVCPVPLPWRDMLGVAGGCAAMVAVLVTIPFPYSLGGAILQIATGALVYAVSIVCLDLAGIGRTLLSRLGRSPRVSVAGPLAAIFALLLVGACTNPPNATAPVLHGPAPAKEGYRLQPGDEVEVRFFDVPQLDDRAVVRPDGSISLQLAGNVEAAGKTIPELQQAVAAKYKGILKNPQISVALRTVAPQRIFVDGEVLKPGIVEATDTITAEMAIASAGGMKTSAKASRVLLIRRTAIGQSPQVSVLDLDSVQDGTDPSADVQLVTNDILFVPRSEIGNVNKWVDLYLRQNIPVNFGYNIP